MSKKKLNKWIAASVIAGSLTMFPAVCSINMIGLPINLVSVAHAELQRYTGVGESIISDRETLEIGKQGAKMQAIRNAQEQAGVFLSSQTVVKNARLQSDEIMAFTAGVVHVDEQNIKYELIPLNDNLGTAKYRATVVVIIDTDELNDKINKWLERDSQQRTNLVNQNNELQRIIDEQATRIKELEQTIVNSNGTQNKTEIQNEIAAISNETLYAQRFEEGNKLYENGDYQGAIAKYTEAIKLNPKYASAYNNRGVAYADLQNYTQAIADYTKAIELNPKNAEAYNNRGIAYGKMKNYEAAIADFNKAIQLNPKYAKAYYNRGFAYYNMENYEAAIADYTKAIQLNPKYAEAYNNRGVAYRHMKNYDAAIADFTKAISISPNHWQMYYGRALCYQALGNNVRAQADYAKARQLGYNG